MFNVEVINLKQIKNEIELTATQNKINSILDKKNLTQDDLDYLKVLGMLVYEYEETEEVIPEIEGIELLQAVYEESGEGDRDLLDIFADESAILDILKGDRELTTEQERELKRRFIDK